MDSGELNCHFVDEYWTIRINFIFGIFRFYFLLKLKSCNNCISLFRKAIYVKYVKLSIEIQSPFMLKFALPTIVICRKIYIFLYYIILEYGTAVVDTKTCFHIASKQIFGLVLAN